LKIGFIGFGEVASILSQEIIEEGVDVGTCLKGRSKHTQDRARNIGVEICDDYGALIKYSDFIFSAVTPAQAVNVAKEVSKTNKIYIDLNNISPETVRLALQQIESGKTVDAAIMGSVRRNGLNVKIIASGPCTEKITVLNDYGMNIEVIGPYIGQASAIKMLRSAYTKGVSALLIESLYVAYENGIDDQVLRYISETEGTKFSESAISRIISSSYHAKRKKEEMEEVVKMVNQETTPIMNKATFEFFQDFENILSGLDKKPSDIKGLFDVIEKLKKDQ
jgi:3-hydroxyisobutyrate dehydrogenase-like beta-hydroxyacid dehydrogenase